MAIRTWLGKEAECNPPPARRTPSDPVVPVSCWHGVYFPTGYTVAVVDDVEEARACVRELVDVGVPPACSSLPPTRRSRSIAGSEAAPPARQNHRRTADRRAQHPGRVPDASRRGVAVRGVPLARHGPEGAGAADPRPARRSRAAPLRALDLGGLAAPRLRLRGRSRTAPWAGDAHETQERDRGGGQIDAPAGERVSGVAASQEEVEDRHPEQGEAGEVDPRVGVSSLRRPANPQSRTCPVLDLFSDGVSWTDLRRPRCHAPGWRRRS
jgi:hypothetical protein